LTRHAVELHRVSKVFGAVRAIVGASMRFEGGRVGVIEGANGAGKSTLLAILATLVRPSSGSIDYGLLGRERSELRRALGWIGSESLCYPDLTGRQNIELAARLHGLPPASTFDTACERFGLGGFAGRAVRTYSRGQRQRVALARALIHRPSLLLLDEPTTGLDAFATAQLAQIVREEVGRGAIVIVATHEPAFARAVGDDRFRMSRGRLRRQPCDAGSPNLHVDPI
jgi:ABC-type multidrug transport system ATPase subunit